MKKTLEDFLGAAGISFWNTIGCVVCKTTIMSVMVWDNQERPMYVFFTIDNDAHNEV